MRIGIPREIHAGEKRVAATPEVAEQLRLLGYQVAIEAAAGKAARFSDAAYREAGVEIIASARALWESADIILKVRPPETHPELCIDETGLLGPGKVLISFIQPAIKPELLRKLAATGATVLAMDAVPRISRAQKMDALSSMANIAGYRAVIEAAQHFGRFFTGQITAAGKVPPAKVLVIGAGVAGLSAIGTAKSMGAIVRAFDTRPEVKEQVESMDAEFLMLDFGNEATAGEGGYAKVMSEEFIRKEMELFARQATEVDIVITTALIPGKPAPELWTPAMVEAMREGSVIVDLGAEMGGNCRLTEKDAVVVKHGVTLIGYTDLPSRLASQASQLYGTNLRHLLADMTPGRDGQLTFAMDDEVIRAVTVVKEGAILWPPPQPRLYAVPEAKAAPAPVPAVTSGHARGGGWLMPALIAALALLALGAVAPPSFMSHFTVFVLACFVGYMVVWNVKPALHTPLMSVTNAISSIIVIGALLQVSAAAPLNKYLAALALLLTAINIVGGFAVTQRMLAMFRK